MQYTTFMQIKKALLTAAGFGTRFLPITKTIQKEMLPILNRPIIDYTVADCVQAGIEEIIFVISEHNTQLVHFYRENLRLKSYLEQMNKIELYGEVEHLHSQVKITFVRQPDAAQYGTAVPVKIAREHLENEAAFLVFMGDDFIFNADGSSEVLRMMDALKTHGASALTTCIQVPQEDVGRYGVVAPKDTYFLDYLVEKPDPAEAPSSLINISKYVLTPAVFDIIAQQEPNPQSGELYITDTVTTLAQNQPVLVYEPKGVYLDGGNLPGWLKANLITAWQDPSLRQPLVETLTALQQRESA